MHTNIPGRDPIELIAFYPQFANYYPNCEMQTKKWFVQHVKEDWTIIDVGANIGYYTLLFSQLAPKGHVLAIEPTETFAMLMENVKHNQTKDQCGDNVDCWRCAMGAKSGKIEDGIFKVWGQAPEFQEYTFVTIDDFIDRENLHHVDAIKIDVDSYDFEVLQGAESTLEHLNPYVMVELNHALGKRGQSAEDALKWLAARGYSDPEVYDGENYLLKR